MAFQAAICIVDNLQNESNHAVEDMAQEYLDWTEYHMAWKALLEKFTIDEVKWVEKVHIQMGHPSSDALAAALKEMNADDRLVSCARIYICEICPKRQRPKAVRIARIPKDRGFNDTIDIDTFHVNWNRSISSSVLSWTRARGTKSTRS